MTPRRVLRHIINLCSGITLFGVLLGTLTRGRPHWNADHGLLIFHNCYLPWRWASAVTFGDVVLVLSPPIRWANPSDLPPQLLAHEARHACQYAWMLGFPYFPVYWVACAYSWVVTGDHWSRNVFEVRAGLADGGYVPKMSRRTQNRALDF